MARTLFWDRNKWKRARHFDWNTKRGRDCGYNWNGAFSTKNVCPHFCLDQFKFGESEFVFKLREVRSSEEEEFLESGKEGDVLQSDAVVATGILVMVILLYLRIQSFLIASQSSCCTQNSFQLCHQSHSILRI